ncbi:MAG: class II fructose-bisphosphate aldolase [Rhodospirillaceae bacterium]|jgi:fructose/tagatose bisphosphate aldolase
MTEKKTIEPIIIVHDLEQATAALQAAAALQQTITLQSAPEAAAYFSPPVFRAMIEQAAAAVPDAKHTAILDCGDQTGLAMNALRHGVQGIRIDCGEDVFAKLVGIAKQTGAYVRPYDDAPALDLNMVEDVTTACRDWLEGIKATPL